MEREKETERQRQTKEVSERQIKQADRAAHRCTGKQTETEAYRGTGRQTET